MKDNRNWGKSKAATIYLANCLLSKDKVIVFTANPKSMINKLREIGVVAKYQENFAFQKEGKASAYFFYMKK